MLDDEVWIDEVLCDILWHFYGALSRHCFMVWHSQRVMRHVSGSSWTSRKDSINGYLVASCTTPRSLDILWQLLCPLQCPLQCLAACWTRPRPWSPEQRLWRPGNWVCPRCFVHFLQNFGELPGFSVSQLWHPFPCSQEENMHIYYSGSYYMIDMIHCMLESWNPEELFGFAAAAYRCVSLRAMTTFDPDDFLEQFNTADIASAVAAADGTWESLRICEWLTHGDNMVTTWRMSSETRGKWRNSDRFLVTLILHCHHQVIIHQRRLRRALGKILHRKSLNIVQTANGLKLISDWFQALNPRASTKLIFGKRLNSGHVRDGVFKVLEWHLQCFCVRGTSHAIC